MKDYQANNGGGLTSLLGKGALFGAAALIATNPMMADAADYSKGTDCKGEHITITQKVGNARKYTQDGHNTGVWTANIPVEVAEAGGIAKPSGKSYRSNVHDVGQLVALMNDYVVESSDKRKALNTIFCRRPTNDVNREQHVKLYLLGELVNTYDGDPTELNPIGNPKITLNKTWWKE